MKKLHAIFFIVLVFYGCSTNPLTGQKTMAFIQNRTLFPQSFAEYDQFLGENTVIENTPDAIMVKRVGERLADAAQVWLASKGYPNYLDDYKWQYELVKDDQVNAWCMPGGKIVVYTGILPVTETEQGLAVVLGHEISHALCNHGQQRLSASVLQQLGALGTQILFSGQSETVQNVIMAAYAVGTTVGGTLRFSRQNESEADHYGLILMAIAGYNPEEAVIFWSRMAKLGSSGPEFLSTHPASTTRVNQLKGWMSEAKETAASFGVVFD